MHQLGMIIGEPQFDPAQVSPMLVRHPIAIEISVRQSPVWQLVVPDRGNESLKGISSPLAHVGQVPPPVIVTVAFNAGITTPGQQSFGHPQLIGESTTLPGAPAGGEPNVAVVSPSQTISTPLAASNV